MTTQAPNTIKGVIEAMAALDKQISEIGNEAIVQQANQVFAQFPDAKAIFWNQSTPSFNDGDPCLFSVGDIYLDTGKCTQEEIDEEGLCEEEYGYDNGDYARAKIGDTPDTDYKLYREYSKEFNTLMAPIREIPDMVMMRVFGDGKAIRITRDGTVEVEDYEGGY